MRRLIWNFTGRTHHIVWNIMSQLICDVCQNPWTNPSLDRPVSSKRYKLAWYCVPIEHSDQPAHPHSLIIVYEWHSIYTCSQCSRWKLRLWPDCAESGTQTDFNLRFTRMPTCTLCWTSWYSKTCLKRPLSKRPKLILKTNYRLMQAKALQNAPLSTFIKLQLVIKIFVLSFSVAA